MPPSKKVSTKKVSLTTMFWDISTNPDSRKKFLKQPDVFFERAGWQLTPTQKKELRTLAQDGQVAVPGVVNPMPAPMGPIKMSTMFKDADTTYQNKPIPCP